MRHDRANQWMEFLHDALKRRCLYHWIDYPSFEREYAILTLKVPDASERLAREITTFIQELRHSDLYKIPGIAETLDWAEALTSLDQEELDPQVVQDTLGALLKYKDDLALIQGERALELLSSVKAEA